MQARGNIIDLHSGSALCLLGMLYLNSQFWSMVITAYGRPTFLIGTVTTALGAFPGVSGSGDVRLGRSGRWVWRATCCERIDS